MKWHLCWADYRSNTNEYISTHPAPLRRAAAIIGPLVRIAAI
ncbi:MAG: hypothetical protein ACNYPH_04875 [Gammaproteobacteria bacterium WSBS_2016_MAG_OTU1]